MSVRPSTMDLISQRVRTAVMLAISSIFVFAQAPAFSQTAAQDFSQGVALSMQDSQVSPSDSNPPIQLNLNDATGSTASPLATQPPSPPSPPSAARVAPQPPASRPRPQAATLGSRQPFRALGSSAVYTSPFTSLATATSGTNASAVSSYFGSTAHRKLSRMPEMFGDLRRPGAAINFQNPTYTSTDTLNGEAHRPQDFPTSVAFSGLRISENNVAMPQDRFWVGYNHFHNAFAQTGGDLSLDRFVFGFEKTLFAGTSSLEVRLPIAASIEPNGAFSSSTSYAGGSYGNLALLLKHVLYADDDCVLAAGLGIETPTGSQSHAFDNALGPVQITHNPAAVYLTPYLGFQKTVSESWFANGFIQIDMPTAGDELIAAVGAGPQQTFSINQPTFLQIDLGIGAWLLAPSDSDPTGLALISELHIATALQEADQFEVVPGGATPNVFVNTGDSINTLVNYTNGIHAALDNGWSLRCGVAVPLLRQRIFDTEALVQLNRAF